MDRAWYDLDEGFDERDNPFANMAEEYIQKKEEQLAKHTVKKISARQRQVNKVCLFFLKLWNTTNTYCL